MGTFSASIFVLIFGRILDAFLTHFGHLLDPNVVKKNQSEKSHRKKVVPGRSETFLRKPSWGPRRANYQRGLVIKKVQLFEDSVIRRFGDSDIRYCIR